METVFDGLRVQAIHANVDDESTWPADAYLEPYSWMCLVERGRPTIHLSRRTVTLSRGWMVLVPLNTLTDYRCSGPVSVHAVALTCRLCGNFDLFDLVPPPGKVRPPDLEDAIARFTRIRELASPESAGEVLERDSLCRGLLAVLLRGVPAGGPVPPWRQFARVLSYIEQHLAEPIALRDLADLMHWHPTHFADQFARVLGTPPRRYITRKRVEMAQTLLDSTALRVKEVANRVGYEDQYHFSRVFRAVSGSSPTEYRNRLSRAKGEQPRATIPRRCCDGSCSNTRPGLPRSRARSPTAG